MTEPSETLVAQIVSRFGGWEAFVVHADKVVDAHCRTFDESLARLCERIVYYLRGLPSDEVASAREIGDDLGIERSLAGELLAALSLEGDEVQAIPGLCSKGLPSWLYRVIPRVE
ncbi:hypothetical protein [Miltoncostaea oceani]|uniref:hypothetical protein n=1 Tax=Miltoncostaea oceani TaxID=2843216 RepID=UPI001C3CD6AA|nr:hypothetical protein [Miltoncostaea oceani]